MRRARPRCGGPPAGLRTDQDLRTDQPERRGRGGLTAGATHGGLCSPPGPPADHGPEQAASVRERAAARMGRRVRRSTRRRISRPGDRARAGGGAAPRQRDARRMSPGSAARRRPGRAVWKAERVRDCDSPREAAGATGCCWTAGRRGGWEAPGRRSTGRLLAGSPRARRGHPGRRPSRRQRRSRGARSEPGRSTRVPESNRRPGRKDPACSRRSSPGAPADAGRGDHADETSRPLRPLRRQPTSPRSSMPALEQLEAAFLDCQGTIRLSGASSTISSATYAGRPTPLYRCRNLAGAARRHASISSGKTCSTAAPTRPTRRSARACWPADGQAPPHRRDRGRPARRRYRAHRRGARSGRPASTWARSTWSARSRTCSGCGYGCGGGSGHHRLPHAQGRHQRSAARLVRQLRGTPTISSARSRARIPFR